MSAYPGARLLYGIDLRDKYGEMPEGWDSDDVEETLKAVSPKLGLHFTGNLYDDGGGYVLALHETTVYAYDTLTLTAETLELQPLDREVVQAAFRELFPDQEVPEPQWMITVHCG